MAQIGNILQSDNYSTSGTYAGWRLDKTGTLYANAISIKNSSGGTVFATGTGFNWNNVTGTNIPESNATAGATWGSNVANQPTSLSGISATEGSKLSGVAAGATANASLSGTGTPSTGTGQTGDSYFDMSTGLMWWKRSTGWAKVLPKLTVTNVSTFISDVAIGQAQIGNAAIGEAQIIDGSITNAKICTAAIGTANIIDANITTLKVAGGAITAPSFASGNTNDLYLTYTLSGVSGENYSIFILATMECSYQAPLNLYAGPSGGTLSLLYRVVSPIGGTLAAKGWVVIAPPGTYTVRLFSEHSGNINGASIYVLATKR
jgi:hypothetical protein